MSTVQRPLSPHLQVYRPQLTSILSITHRVTGIALSLGAIMLVAQLVSAASGPEAYDRFSGFAGSWFGLALLVGWSFALFYHLCNGIRHLVWDTGTGLELPDAYRSGVIVVALSVLLTAAVWLLAIFG